MAAVTTRALSVENGQLSFSTERGVLSASILGLGLGVDERGWAILTGVLSGPGAGGLLIETPTGWTTQRLPVGRSVSGAAVADASAIWVPMSFGQLLRIARR
jgi:hypothetical protein